MSDLIGLSIRDLIDDFAEKGEPVHAGHQEIEQDHRWALVVFEPLQRAGAVFGLGDLAAKSFEMTPSDPAARGDAGAKDHCYRFAGLFCANR